MISKDRQSFIFHKRWFEVLAEFSGEIQLEVIDAACNYAKTGITPELSSVAQGLFAFVKYDMENDGIECPDLAEME